MKYIHNFVENFLRLLLVGLHGFIRRAWIAPDMLPTYKGQIYPCPPIRCRRPCSAPPCSVGPCSVHMPSRRQAQLIPAA
ncbi:hypothetical protein PAHAL_8G126300 [Panicum hallii]|uniref:Uncharacterized protein n=1 Tax=Panicum hallii TaxID=206008 RepID=A0A2T8I8Q5_9POAL|nr:hypothetical protein PAHAL_8G126300 [Panicum hallii]